MRLGEAVVKEPWATVDLGVAALRGAATGIRQFAVLPLRWSCVYANAKVSFQSLGDGIRPEPLHRKQAGRRVEVVCPETVQESLLLPREKVCRQHFRLHRVPPRIERERISKGGSTLPKGGGRKA